MKVLVVDDREENRAILQVKLKAHGYESETAGNGAEALAMLRDRPFVAVIADLLMPVMDGYQLTHAIKSDDRIKDVPVIIYTSTYTDPKDEALARNLGANAYLLKPATDEKFFALLTDTIARAARGELPSLPVSQDEVQRLRDYTARLIHKLEDKIEEVSTLNATLEQRVAAATAELREANAELETYVNTATHDLRAPLRAIEGFSALLREEGERMPAEDRRRLLGRIEASAAQMQRLMQDLLDYSRLKQREIVVEKVALSEVVREALARIGPEIDRSHAVVEVSPRLPDVRGVAPILVQAVANLFSNAIKFVAPGARPKVAVSAERQGETVRLAIRDNGIGIAPDDRPKIFRVFERLHDPTLYPGTGIGLASVKRAVTKMGGDLGFESEPGRGSVFWIELPEA